MPDMTPLSWLLSACFVIFVALAISVAAMTIIGRTKDYDDVHEQLPKMRDRRR